MASLRIEGLHVTLRGREVLRGVDLAVGDGEAFALLGSSGAGKTTVLRAVAGLVRPERGAVLLDGVDVTRWPPGQRDVAMVFQQAPLDPTRDVHANLRFPLSLRRVPHDEAERRIAAEARAFSIQGLLERLPGQLSEGQRHAAATARGMLRAPRLLLLDEPLADLDPVARGHAVGEIATVQAGYAATLLIATNDQRTAALLGHRVAVLQDGRIAQVGPFPDLYDRPATVGVAQLLGDPPMTLLPGRVVTAAGRRPRLVAGGLERATHDPAVARLAGGAVTLGVRPEQVRRAIADGAHATGEVVAAVLLGADGLVTVRLDGGGDLVARLPRPLPRPGDPLTLQVTRVHVFGPDERLVTVAR